MYLVEVIFPQPISKGYHYLSENKVSLGHRVLVELKKGLTVGLVWNCIDFDQAEIDPKVKYKPIAEVLDDHPVYPEGLFRLIQGVANYYLTPLGLVCKTAFPTFLFKVPTKRVRLTKLGKDLLPLREDLRALERHLQGDLSLKEFLKRTGLKPKELKSLELEGIIQVYPDIPKVRLRKEKIVRIGGKDDLPSELRELFSVSGELPFSVLIKRFSEKKVKEFIKMGYLEVYEIPKLRKINLLTEDITDHPLTSLQRKVVDEIWEKVRTFGFEPMLLYGVTGSGKTLVYLELIRRVVASGKRVLLLLPEIILTSYMERVIFRHFGAEVAVLHSALPSSQRYSEWIRILEGKVSIVVGTRSAVFAPVENLGLIIVDEEHDPSYKEENLAPRYNARDVALIRGALYGVPVLLGSATPSVKSYYHAKNGKYHYFELSERPFSRLPEIRVVENRGFHLLTKQVIEDIRRTLEDGKSVFLFLNRRGYAPLVRCEDCHHVFSCPNCDLPLTYHLDDNTLKCHHCFFEASSGLLCPNCGSGFVRLLRAGTERVEEEVRKYFPDHEVVRFDRDTAGSDKRVEALLTRLYSPDPKVIVSTQIGVHGHNFPRVSLVVVLRGEEGLMIPTFRSAERTFQLLVQACGRAGRKDEQGRVILQTAFPEHYVMRYAQNQDYQGFFAEEIMRRKGFLYPPFVRLALIKLSGVKEERVLRFGERLWRILEEIRKEKGLKCQIYPPCPSPLRKLRGLYRWHILVKSPRHAYLVELLPEALAIKEAGIRAELDLDPEDLM